MTFISYAQNFEDVMLWRALKHIPNGFYIDVGANNPDQDSVTKAFYQRGWRGINIEPVGYLFDLLNIKRPLDINVRCAISNEPGELKLWECNAVGLTTADPEAIEKHIKDGFSGYYFSVPIRSLNDVCMQYSPQEIHFLKIDVEGLEKQVLESIDLSKHRPWIIVIEATKPNSMIETHGDWDHLITRFDYQHVYSDGLNRFYIANEKPELKQFFEFPPNVFDQFVVANHLKHAYLLDQ